MMSSPALSATLFTSSADPESSSSIFRCALCAVLTTLSPIPFPKRIHSHPFTVHQLFFSLIRNWHYYTIHYHSHHLVSLFLLPSLLLLSSIFFNSSNIPILQSLQFLQQFALHLHFLFRKRN